MYVVTSQEMAEIDKITIEKVGIPGIVLMENAAKGAFEFFLEVMPDLLRKSIGVVVGPGNNGGDGLAIARLLHNQKARVKIFCVRRPEYFTEDALINYKIVHSLGIPIFFLSEEGIGEEWNELLESDVIIDALLGTGLKREVTGTVRKVIEAIVKAEIPVLAVDIPSGIDGSSGKVMGVALKAVATATFGLPKIGHVIWPGMYYTGKLKVVDIGIPPSVIESRNISRYIITKEILSTLIEPRSPIIHKGQAGHLTILAGSAGKTGAASMVALASLRVGAGLVTVMIPKSLNPIMEVKLTEPMTFLLEETEDQSVSLREENKILDFLAGKQCLAIGPGSSLNAETQELLRRIIVKSPCPLVIDADGLTAISKYPDILKQVTVPAVLTPHPGEMARLCGCSTLEIQNNRLEIAEKFSKEMGVTLVLKGHRTIIADPSGRTAINVTGNPAMASGGMGDILTGLIAGFICQGLDAFESACLGVYIHGLAADRVVARRGWGTRGLIATDLLEEIPGIIKELEG